MRTCPLRFKGRVDKAVKILATTGGIIRPEGNIDQKKGEAARGLTSAVETGQRRGPTPWKVFTRSWENLWEDVAGSWTPLFKCCRNRGGRENDHLVELGVGRQSKRILKNQSWREGS